MHAMNTEKEYLCRGGIRVKRSARELPVKDATASLIDALDNYPGALLSSSCEYPGRYRRWDIGFVMPPLKFTGRGRRLEVRALNERGEVLLPALERALSACEAAAEVVSAQAGFDVLAKPPQAILFEEERSRRHSLFSLLRAVIEAFGSGDDSHLGLYGAFGYELAFQFEPVIPRLPREDGARDLVLYLPDEIVLVDHMKEEARVLQYDFSAGAQSTAGLPRKGESRRFVPATADPPRPGDHAPGEYADTVRKALEHFRRGDLFETVPGQVFFERCRDRPSAVFRRLRERNPAPYGALINLGEGEYLVAASPEMYVRVEGRRVETCPISGTIARGRDALEDAERIRALLNSDKDRAELSMCTDVDRNDKARVCEPGSVKVIGRRQIELYSRLIHTVDHVEGRLRAGFDALDAFLSHAWAVTVTGAPKQAAIQFIEDHEKSPRRWYGGAMGALYFNGNMNTGLTLRTLRIQDGMAEVRAGATLLFDSDPEAEEAETRLKASALLDAVRNAAPASPGSAPSSPAPGAADAFSADGFEPGGTSRPRAPRVLMVDHRDSFVLNLAAYFRAAGARVDTVRPERFEEALAQADADLVVLSPGPGVPADFAMKRTIGRVLDRGLPLFGVCLGLQGIVEYFGGSLARLDIPMHGKDSSLVAVSGPLFRGLASGLRVGRYHSLAAASLPACLRATARTEDSVVMAVEHRSLPVSAVQFHPESILSLDGDAGMVIIRNVLAGLAAASPGDAQAAVEGVSG